MSISCGRCPGWTNSPVDDLSFFNDEWSACEGCTHKEVMRVLARQLRSRQPQWWVVDGRVVIPIWIVERLRNRFQSGQWVRSFS